MDCVVPHRHAHSMKEKHRNTKKLESILALKRQESSTKCVFILNLLTLDHELTCIC